MKKTLKILFDLEQRRIGVQSDGPEKKQPNQKVYLFKKEVEGLH